MTPRVSGTFSDESADWQGWLGARPLAVCMTAGADGYPHATPVEVVVRDGKVYVWCHSGSAKARNAERERRGSIMAYKSTTGVLVRGPVRLVRAGEPGYDDLARAFLTKYNREETYGNDVLLEFTPERVSGWT